MTAIRTLARLLLATCTLLPAVAAAGPNECSVEVKVQTEFQTPWVEYVDAAVLNKRPRQNGQNLWLGSTTSRLKTSVIASIEQHPTGKGGCLQVQVLVMLAMSRHDVSIANELRGLSCLHREVSEHEQRHVEANRRVLLEMSPVLQEELEREVRVIVATQRTASAVRTWLSKYVNAALSPRVQAIWSDKARVHAEIDSPEEYRRILDACRTDAVKINAILASRGL